MNLEKKAARQLEAHAPELAAALMALLDSMAHLPPLIPAEIAGAITRGTAALIKAGALRAPGTDLFT